MNSQGWVKIAFLLLLMVSSLSAEIQYVSVAGKQSSDNTWKMHAIWIGSIADCTQTSIQNNELLFENSSLADAVQNVSDWAANALLSGDSLAVICDQHNLEIAFRNAWTDISPISISFYDIREDVRNSFGKRGFYGGWSDPLMMPKQSYDAKMMYLAHSSPSWKMIERNYNEPNFGHQFNKDDLAILRQLNFEQLRAYFWLTGRFQPKNNDMAHYWISQYYGNEVHVTAGRYLFGSYAPVVDSTGSMEGEGVVIDIFYNGRNNTVFCIATLKIANRRIWDLFWEHDNACTLYGSFHRFLGDF